MTYTIMPFGFNSSYNIKIIVYDTNNNGFPPIFILFIFVGLCDICYLVQANRDSYAGYIYAAREAARNV